MLLGEILICSVITEDVLNFISAWVTVETNSSYVKRISWNSFWRVKCGRHSTVSVLTLYLEEVTHGEDSIHREECLFASQKGQTGDMRRWTAEVMCDYLRTNCEIWICFLLNRNIRAWKCSLGIKVLAGVITNTSPPSKRKSRGHVYNYQFLHGRRWPLSQKLSTFSFFYVKLLFSIKKNTHTQEKKNLTGIMSHQFDIKLPKLLIIYK